MAREVNELRAAVRLVRAQALAFARTCKRRALLEGDALLGGTERARLLDAASEFEDAAGLFDAALSRLEALQNAPTSGRRELISMRR